MEYVLLLALFVSITTPAQQIEVVRKENRYRLRRGCGVQRRR
jgi:hypothetical protein